MLSSMENYKIFEQLGNEAPATVFRVEGTGDAAGKVFALKKIECFDESEANIAFRESQPLRELDHPYVSGYKEYFVMWQKEDSTMCMCVITDYFKNGHLGNQIRKWLGQIIEALVYAHTKNIIHRNIKPSNIYLQDENHLRLGDFSVPSVIGDAKTCPRSSPSVKYYMAPEASNGGDFTKSCDVWSLGVLLLELVNVTTLDENEFYAHIKEIKEDASELDRVLENNYSPELVSVIKEMLKISNRPTALDLRFNNEYVAKCVDMVDAAQLEKRKRQQSARKDKNVPRDQGILPVIEYLAKMVDFEDCARQALEYLVELAKQEDTSEIDARAKRLIKFAMRNNLEDKDIQIFGCSVFSNLIITAAKDDILYTPEIVSVIPLAMEKHLDSADLQQAAAALLMALASNEGSAEVIGHFDGIQNVLNAMRKHQNNPELCSTCCHALWSLAVNATNIQTAIDEKGLDLVCSTLKNHMNSQDVVEAASAALLSLSLHDESLKYIGDLDCVGLLINAIETHMKNAKVVKNACQALASLVEQDEESAYRVLTNEAPGGGHIPGVPKILKAYELHKDNAEVVESIVTLVMELAEYDDVRAEMRHLNVGPDLLSEIFKRFKENRDIMGPCEKALSKLQAPSKIQSQQSNQMIAV
ncbi:hypothetical protein KUTeg_022335 [Tegillarca granosa]|uniref:non-specific serine/threonine protein kinase n=1 Tax=Tegillarca granosa TaxID=220873 RepID=A0ABQ9E5X5_TEGGR|nr:hypothetical protein KUTeg_022335 [Tegillarca granosa]